MIKRDLSRQIDEIAMRQARLFFDENGHLNDDALDAGLFQAIRRVRENFHDNPALSGIANEIVAAIAAEVWRLRAETRSGDG